MEISITARYSKLTDRRIQMDAQTRRRERRAEKQAQWKAANPLLVGVSAKPVNRPILSLNRKPKSRVESALNPIDLTVLAEYHEQIESNLQRIESKNQRTWYSKPRSEMCHERCNSDPHPTPEIRSRG
ncbi:antitermination protein [Escherichia coli]|nr:antitermination protein [Escherichia coli]